MSAERITLEFAELATLARETILEVRLVGGEPMVVRDWSFDGRVPMLSWLGFSTTRAEIMELAAIGWEWTPCGPACACNALTMVCWGPHDGR